MSFYNKSDGKQNQHLVSRFPSNIREQSQSIPPAPVKPLPPVPGNFPARPSSLDLTGPFFDPSDQISTSCVSVLIKSPTSTVSTVLSPMSITSGENNDQDVPKDGRFMGRIINGLTSLSTSLETLRSTYCKMNSNDRISEYTTTASRDFYDDRKSSGSELPETSICELSPMLNKEMLYQDMTGSTEIKKDELDIEYEKCNLSFSDSNSLSVSDFFAHSVELCIVEPTDEISNHLELHIQEECDDKNSGVEFNNVVTSDLVNNNNYLEPSTVVEFTSHSNSTLPDDDTLDAEDLKHVFSVYDNVQCIGLDTPPPSRNNSMGSRENNLLEHVDLSTVIVNNLLN